MLLVLFVTVVVLVYDEIIILKDHESNKPEKKIKLFRINLNPTPKKFMENVMFTLKCKHNSVYTEMSNITYTKTL